MKKLTLTTAVAVAAGALFLVATPLARAENIYACVDKKTKKITFSNLKLRGHRCKVYLDGGASSLSSGSSKGGRSTSNFKPSSPGSLPRPVVDKRSIKERRTLYETYIQEAANRYRVPAAFIKAVIHIESAFHYRAESSAGAQGLMQLMPRTARAMGVNDAYDPRQNILGGTRLLRVLANRNNGDFVRVLSAYHAGSGAVAKKGGIPYASTEAYVRAVLDKYYKYKAEAP